MSKTRVALRVFLAVMLVSLVAFGYHQWMKSRPDYYYDRAQASLEREDFEAAEINLAKLLSRHPDHAGGHELLSRAILQNAQAKGRPANYLAQPAAAVHLARAAELRPEDVALQRRLLNAYLQMRYYDKAASIADGIYAKDSSDGDAHFALTWRAVTSKDRAQAERLFAEASGIVSRHVFEEFSLRIMHYTDAKDDENLSRVLVEAVQTAHRMSPEDLRLLTRRDREVMVQMLLYCQQHVTNKATSLDISKLVIETVEQLAKDELLDQQRLAEYAGYSQALLNKDTQAVALTERQHWLREQLSDRAGQLSQKAADANKVSSALVYWTTARGQLGEGKHEEALATIEKGIDEWQKALKTDEADEEEVVEPNDELLELHLTAARLLILKQRYAAAAKHLELLRGHKKYEGWGYLLHGNALLSAGDYTAALRELKRAEQSLVQDVQLHTALARAHLGLEQWEPAIEHLEALLVPADRLSENDKAWRQSFLGFDELVHLDLLRARLKMGQWRPAQDDLRALRDTESAPEAWKMTIAFFREQQQQQKAWDYLRRCRELFPNDVDFVFLEAGILRDRDQGSSARRVFEEFAAASPNDPVRRLAMARWMILDGKADNALRVIGTLQQQGNLTQKEINTLDIFRVQALIETERYAEAETESNKLIAQPATGAAGYLLKAAIAWKQGQGPLGADMLAKAQEAQPHGFNASQQTLRVLTPEGQVVGVEIHDAYYW